MENYTPVADKNEGKREKFDKYLILTLLLILFHTIGNAIWIYLNKAPLNWDPSIHLINTFKYAQYLKEIFTNFNLISFLQISNYYPIFIYLINIPFIYLFSENYKIITFTSSLFFGLSILFLYLYTVQLFKKTNLAFYSAFIFSFFITINQSSREFMLDLPLTTLIIISLYYLEKFRQNFKVRNIYLFFLFFSFAQLTKWYAFIYLLLPIIYFVIHFYKSKKGLPIKHIVLNIIMFLLIVSPWYWVNFIILFIKSSRAWFGEAVVKPNIFSTDFLLSHLKLLIIFQLNFFGFITLMLSSFLLIKSKYQRKWEIILVVIFNYLFFTFIPNRNIRYLIPLTPFIAIIMGYGASILIESRKMLIRVFCMAFLAYYVISYLVLTFGIPIRPYYKYAFNFPILSWVDVYYLSDYPVKLIYDKNIWPHDQILTDINSLSDYKDASFFLCADKYYLNADYFNLLILTRKLTNLKISSYYRYEDLPNFLKDFDYIIIPKINVVGEDKNYVSYKPLTIFQQYFLSGKAINFELVKTYILPQSQSLIPDSDILYLYKKIQ